MPAAALRDTMEWPFEPSAERELDFVLKRETSLSRIIASDPNAVAMQDDRPVNEYVLLRKLESSRTQPGSLVAWYEHTRNP
jgi:hypothetical protein